MLAWYDMVPKGSGGGVEVQTKMGLRWHEDTRTYLPADRCVGT